MNIVKVCDKAIINKTKKRFKESEFVNTTVFEYFDSKFTNIKKRSYDKYEKIKKLHDIQFPNIDKICNALVLGEKSFGYQTYRRYNAWVVTWNNIIFIITHNSDRGTDVFCEENTSPETVYNFLFDYYKTIYSSDGSTNFEDYYPTWDNA